MKGLAVSLGIAVVAWMPLVSAETMGIGSFVDARIQTAVFSPDDVYRVSIVSQMCLRRHLSIKTVGRMRSQACVP